MRRVVAFLVPLAAAGLLAALALGAGTAGDDAKAFDRPTRPADTLPSWLVDPVDGFGVVTVSRLVATYDGGPKRRGRQYVFKTSKGQVCTFFVWKGAGGGCSPGPLFARRRIVAGAGQFLSGIAADEVTRVVVIGSRGVRHRVPLSSDNGFIYDCRSYNGCPCAIAWLDAYAGSRRVAHENWLGSGCGRKRR